MQEILINKGFSLKVIRSKCYHHYSEFDSCLQHKYHTTLQMSNVHNSKYYLSNIRLRQRRSHHFKVLYLHYIFRKQLSLHNECSLPNCNSYHFICIHLYSNENPIDRSSIHLHLSNVSNSSLHSNIKYYSLCIPLLNLNLLQDDTLNCIPCNYLSYHRNSKHIDQQLDCIPRL